MKCSGTYLLDQQLFTRQPINDITQLLTLLRDARWIIDCDKDSLPHAWAGRLACSCSSALKLQLHSMTGCPSQLVPMLDGRWGSALVRQLRSVVTACLKVAAHAGPHAAMVAFPSSGALQLTSSSLMTDTAAV